jgi:hypothetical protein
VQYGEGISTVKMMSADPSETSVTTCHTLQEVVIQITLHYFAAFIGLFFLNGDSGMCLPLTELSHCKDTPTHTNSAVEDVTITKIVGDLYSD